MIGSRLSSFLDAARWVAAVAVLVSHVRVALFVPFTEADTHGALARGFYAITKLGHEAVVVFFVISGMLVGGITCLKWSKHRADLASYSTARFSRIYVVLVPTLLVGGLLDYLGQNIAPDLYRSAEPRLTAAHFLINAASLQTIALPPFGSNSPLWSLANEWWYYVIFGAIAYTVYGTRPPFRWSCAITALALLIILPLGLIVWGLIWLAGVALVVILNLTIRRPPLLIAWIGFTCAILASLILRRNLPDEISGNLLQLFIPDAILSVAFCILVAAYDTSRPQIPLTRNHSKIAEFSFSLYAIHMPLILFLIALGGAMPAGKFKLSPATFTIFVVVNLIAIGCSWVFYWCFERNTPAIRALITATLSKRMSGLPPQSR